MWWCLGGRSGWSYCVCTWSFLETAKSQATWALHLKPHPQSYCVLDSLSLHMHLWHRYFWELSQLTHLHLSLSPPVRLRTARCGSNGFLFFVAVVLIVHQFSSLNKNHFWRAEPQNRKGTERGRPLGQVCTILQIQVKCLLSLLVVIAIGMKVGQICFPFTRLKISLCWNLNLSTCVCQPLILNIRRLLLRNWGPCLYFAKPPYFGSTLSRETSTGFLVHSHWKYITDNRERATAAEILDCGPVGVKYPPDPQRQRRSTGGQQLARDVSNLYVATFSKLAFVCNSQERRNRPKLMWTMQGKS